MATANAINANSAGLVIYNGSGTFTATTTTNHNLLIGAASNAITNVAPSATSGVPVISQGASADPVFGTAVVAGGGTGNVTQAAFSLVCGGTTTTGAFQAVADVATGQVLVSGGTGALPAFSATPSVTSITLSGGTALSNYAEGTWTPVLTFGGSSTGITYSTQNGSYTRIGNFVRCTFCIVLSSKGAQVGTALITGLPFTVVGSNDTSSLRNDGITYTAGYTYSVAQALTSGTTAGLYQEGSNVTSAVLANTAFANTSVVQGNIFITL